MKQQFDSIIFDMDGVLVTNASYVQSIKKTVEKVLRQTYFVQKTVCDTYISEIKNITGFNNDWDTSYALVKLLGNNVPVEAFKKEVQQITPAVRESDSYIQIKNIFQNYYLGTNNTGYICNETLLIQLPVLKKLSTKYALGIATSRPRFEAQFAAKNLELTPIFIPKNWIVAKEDAPREKPYPDPLLEAKKRMNCTNPVYVGDTINDTLAAEAAGMTSIYVGTQKLGAYQIQNTNQLAEVLL